MAVIAQASFRAQDGIWLLNHGFLSRKISKGLLYDATRSPGFAVTPRREPRLCVEECVEQHSLCLKGASQPHSAGLTRGGGEAC